MLNRPNSTMKRRSMRGFTLLEMLISISILITVTSVVFAQIMQMQKKSSSEAAKLDMTQSAREFVDQMGRDLHMAGYPKASMYAAPADPKSNLVAVGLVSVSPTQIQLEGDVNNDGTVQSVRIFYVAADPNDPTCPCIRRSVIPKVQGLDPLNQPINAAYTQIAQVFPPGRGPGASGEDLFTFFDQNGNATANIAAISTVKINLSMLSNLPDPASDGFIRNSITATVKLN